LIIFGAAVVQQTERFSDYTYIRDIYREGVRGVAGVASATPYFSHIKIGSNKKINYE